MKIKVIIGCLLLLLVVSGCSSLIYAIRGSKYKDKFDVNSYPIELDSTTYYVHEYTEAYNVNGYSNPFKYGYLKFKNTGVFYGYTSEEKLTILELDTITPFKNYYIFKNGYLRWEVYHDSYNGYNLYKAEVYKDSIIAWQIGNKRATTKTYYKMK